MSTPSLTVAGLTIAGAHGPIVEDLGLELWPGETIAIVGESGSGKSMTAKALTGLLPYGVSARGSLAIGGEAVALDGSERQWRLIRGRRIALVPQDPFTSLSPRHRCGDQIALSLSKLSRSRRVTAVGTALEEVGLEARVADQYPFQLSGGMRQRVAIAASLITRPSVVIADEATTALDVTTQAEILDLLTRLQAEREMSLILITHDLGVAAGRADRIVVLYAGGVVEYGDCATVIGNPGHPYTAGLLACDPPLHHRLRRLPSIPGAVPRLADVGRECAFAARCQLAAAQCRVQTPPLVEIDPGHRSACLRVDTFRRLSTPQPAWTQAGTEFEERSPSTQTRGTVVAVSGLSKRFGTHRALEDVTLHVRAGEAVAVVGESGSGKTTLARIIVGLETADAGSVGFGDAAAGSRAEHARRAQIVFQDPYSALNPSQSVGASLRDALRAGGRSRSEVPQLLELVGLPTDYMRKRPKLLSGGERQRVAIARALAVRPTLLICDEAVSSLDVSVQAQILNLLGDLREQLGLAVLFISHDLAVVRQAADRIYVLYQGRLVEEGDAAAVLDHPQNDYTRLLMASVPVVEGAAR